MSSKKESADPVAGPAAFIVEVSCCRVRREGLKICG